MARGSVNACPLGRQAADDLHLTATCGAFRHPSIRPAQRPGYKVQTRRRDKTLPAGREARASRSAPAAKEPGAWSSLGGARDTSSGPRRLELETERVDVKDTELPRSQWRPYNPSIRSTKKQVLLRAGVSAQSLEAGPLVGHDARSRVQ